MGQFGLVDQFGSGGGTVNQYGGTNLSALLVAGAGGVYNLVDGTLNGSIGLYNNSSRLNISLRTAGSHACPSAIVQVNTRTTHSSAHYVQSR